MKIIKKILNFIFDCEVYDSGNRTKFMIILSIISFSRLPVVILFLYQEHWNLEIPSTIENQMYLSNHLKINLICYNAYEILELPKTKK